MKTYYYGQNGQSIGPVDEAALMQLRSQGVITPATPVIEQGQQQWSTYGQLFPACCPPPPAAFPAPPVGFPQPPAYSPAPSQETAPIVFRTRRISSLKRLWDTGYVTGMTLETQLEEISFVGSQVFIKWRDGNTLTLQKGQYEATDNLLGHAGSYNIEITTPEGGEYLIRGCDAELNSTAWEKIRELLGCKNRLF